MSYRAPFLLLLAEDDEDIAFLFRRAFRKFEPQWKIEWMRDGLQAIDYCENHGLPQVIVTDLNMPRLDGFGVIAWVQKQQPHVPTSIVVYSSSDDEATRERCLQAGAAQFISKATDVARLVELLRRILVARREDSTP